MHTIMRAGLSGLLGLLGLLCLTGCGDGSDKGGPADAVVEDALNDEDEVMRQAAENRKRFLGDGKGQYTPQPVQGF